MDCPKLTEPHWGRIRAFMVFHKLCFATFMRERVVGLDAVMEPVRNWYETPITELLTT